LDAAWTAAWAAVRDAALDAAWTAAWAAVRDAQASYLRQNYKPCFVKTEGM
jgi:hypothetical protein